MKLQTLFRSVGPAKRRAVLVAATVAFVLGTIAIGLAPTAGASVDPLIGTFKFTAGADSGGGVTGSYFRMIQPGGTVNGPYVLNSSSSAADQTYTFLAPGTDGGLITGGYQPEPSPAFDAGGNSLANRIMTPTGFFGVNFGVDTAASDPQTGTSVPTPSVGVDGSGNLSGDLRAFGASWNNQEFNQGSPKPDGTQPGLTAGPTGTYNATTRAFTIDWTSLIVGGPFNGFTGKWHLTGTFDPSGYARPKGATPITASLVPAYSQCTGAGNRTHGAPLAFPSCNPPLQTSNFLTLGTPDSNSAAANSIGHVVLKAKATAPEDVLISAQITDVRCKAATSASVCTSANSAAGADYSGQLQGRLPLRITDRYNGPGLDEPATTQDATFTFPLTCANTTATTIGGDCAVTTTANAVSPGAIQNTKRTIWQIAQIQVNDGGGDGQISTADNTLFEIQGIFIP